MKFIKICLLVFVLIFLFKDLWFYDVLIFKNGNSIESRRIVEVGKVVYYEDKDGMLYTVSKNEVQKIIYSRINHIEDWSDLAVYNLNKKRHIIESFYKNQVANYLMVWIGLTIICLSIIGLVFFKKNIFFKRKTDQSESSVDTSDDNVGISTIQIIEYFLNLYKIHIGEQKVTKANFRLLEDQNIGKLKTYELRVQHGDKWSARRMSIGPIGEDSGSKSKCFYVIYDNHLVLKIPPVPIKECI